jgi:hypothetical protein
VEQDAREGECALDEKEQEQDLQESLNARISETPAHQLAPAPASAQQTFCADCATQKLLIRLEFTGFQSVRRDKFVRVEVASGPQLMHLGIERKSKTGDEAEDDEAHEEVEKARVLLFVFHRNLHVFPDRACDGRRVAGVE